MAQTDLERTGPASPQSRAPLYWAAAVLALVLGFADLWRGGITIAPLLLVLAYVVLIPLAIMKE